MARFQGNVHAGSDKAAATVLFLILLAVVLVVIWAQLDPGGFLVFWNDLTHNVRT